VFAHQGFGARALPSLQSFHDRVMLPMRVAQHVVHLFQVALVEGESLGAGEWNPAIARESFGEQSAPGLGEDCTMKALVHLGVQALVVLLDMPLAENCVAVFQAGAKLPQQGLGRTTLGNLSDGEAFESAAEVNRVDDVLGGKGADHIAPRLMLGKKALLGQERQRLPHRGAGYAQKIRESPEFNHPREIVRDSEQHSNGRIEISPRIDRYEI